MIVFPNAKINLGLYITEKRSDGFHNLESIFYPVDWKDILEITPSKTLSFTSTGIDIPSSTSDNLCTQAYKLLQQDHDIPPVDIHLHKMIPIGAGLGGGSADASFTLKALNELFKLELSNENLIIYAQQLGSDCAFFIENKATFAYEKGDHFKTLDLDLSSYWIKLINPNIHISTKEAYAGVYPNTAGYNLTELTDMFIHEWKLYLQNDFEKSIFPNHPDIEEIKENLYHEGALYASMSGSGSTVYGIFQQEPSANSNDNNYQIKIAKMM